MWFGYVIYFFMFLFLNLWSGDINNFFVIVRWIKVGKVFEIIFGIEEGFDRYL